MNDQIDIYPDASSRVHGKSETYHIRLTYAGNRNRVYIRSLELAWAYSDGFNRALQMLKLPEVPIYEHDLSHRDHSLDGTCDTCELRKSLASVGEAK